MIKKIFILFIALFSYNLFSAEKITVAVLPFSSVNGEEEGDTLASMFANELSKRKVYKVLTRNSQMEKVMKELNFQRQGLTDENTIIQIGRALNAQYVLAGNISKLGRNNILIVSMINVETFENITGDSKSFRNIEDVIQFVPQIINEITGTRGRTVVDIDIFGDESYKNVVTSGDRAALERVIKKRSGEKYIKDIEAAVLIDINRYIRIYEYNGYYTNSRGRQIYTIINNNEYLTPLMIASALKYNDLLKALVSAGADLNLQVKSYGVNIATALTYCILSGNIEGVSILLNAGASIDNREDYLHTAIRIGNVNIAKLLINKGVDINQLPKDNGNDTDYKGKSALVYSVIKRNVDIVKLLLLNNADITIDKEPILYTALIYYEYRIVKLLLDAGVDIDVRDGWGHTPLTIACEKGYTDAVKLLIEYGADVNYADKKGKKPLYYAINSSKKNEIIKLLVDEGATE